MAHFYWIRKRWTRPRLRACLMHLRRGLLVFFSIAMASIALAASAADLVGQASVIDGDTIEIHAQRIRFFGIDAPEHDQLCEAQGSQYRCGQEAAMALSSEIGHQTVHCSPRDVDQYGRIVAVCSAGGEDLNAWMVRNGWALAYRRYSLAYVPDEDVAHLGGVGIWRGTFEDPWAWRRSQHTVAPAAAQSQASATTVASQPATSPCLIKGNISSKGERIYHVPGGYYYDETVIDTLTGERWFCTEAEAKAAGWRKSKL